jgi:DNA-3-methyladenine glycosylase I
MPKKVAAMRMAIKSVAKKTAAKKVAKKTVAKKSAKEEKALWRSDGSCVISGDYHDTVWGRPVTDERQLFGQLSLVTQQCGVSWQTVWNKRESYEQAFCGWDMKRVAAMGGENLDKSLDELCGERWAGKLLRNRQKLGAIIHNARLCVKIAESHAGGLAGFLWSFVLGRDDALNQSTECSGDAYKRMFGATGLVSDEMALAIKGGKARVVGGERLDFKFLGSTTLQAFLLQNGLLDGHSVGCSTCARNRKARPKSMSYFAVAQSGQVSS